ncbi:SDR family oxidoreductase [Micromonospora soli]|uniref:SDR family oxidoreductase n=1 Tax=Micromonospora sp. NBRC 110009 TaxID=3061627 RepID=UPI00267134E2|nr:SDR family oxidoreductase [Micromonospora sp. NBRC 110009]WKU00444.1 SDR family oxidoreductase [Micromonospora sp. NBRC 110009]
MPGTTIVTGAHLDGLGAAAAVRLAETGSDVALIFPDSATRADTMRRLTALPVRSLAIGADVTDADAVAAALQRVSSSLGDPGVLVTVVGPAAPGPLRELSDAAWDVSVELQLRGLFLMTRAVLDPMTRIGSGRVVTVTGADGAVRAGLVGFTRTTALELAPFGVTANLVTSTLGGSGDPEQVAALIPLLVGPAAAAVSGQMIDVGGGPAS